MHSFNFALTLVIALPGVHSFPSLSKSLSTVDASTPIKVARTLPSGDQYPPQPPGAGPGKRGLLYDSKSEVDWSDFYVGSPYVTYGSNGGVVRGNEINAEFSYVPTLVVDASLVNTEWKDLVPVLIEGGTKALFA